MSSALESDLSLEGYKNDKPTQLQNYSVTPTSAGCYSYSFVVVVTSKF